MEFCIDRKIDLRVIEYICKNHNFDDLFYITNKL